MKKTALFLVLSLFLLQNPIVTSISVEPTLITTPKDYEELGIPLDKIQHPHTYERHVLCTGHLPLAFSINSPTSISLSKQQTKQIMSATPTKIQNISSINLSYYILVNTTYTYEEPVYKQKTIQEMQTQNDTKENITINRTINETVGYKTITDYKYIWKELKTLSSFNIKTTDTIIIDIRGTFKASTTEKKVDIIPTLSLAGFQKTYNKYAWWDSNWDYKKEITINHSQVPNTLTNFPVLINITDTDLRDNAQSDGDDICFVNGSEDVQFNHEIEYFDDTTGELVAWVNITTLKHDENTTIYMYYGNDAASNQENVEDTWNSGYLMVQHMEEDSVTNGVASLYDSTINNKDGEPANIDAGDSTDFHIDGAYDIDGSNEKFEVDDISITDSFLVEFYGSPDTVDAGDENRLVDCYEWTNGNGFVTKIDGGTDAKVTLCDAKTTYSSTVSNSVSAGDHMYFAGTWDGTSLKAFINGEFGNDVTVPDTIAENTINPLRIGVRGDSGSGRYFDGKIDEVRLSDVGRSDSWVITSYNTINNATNGGFFSLGNEEIPPSVSQGISISYPSNNSTGHCPCALSFCFTINNSEGNSMNCDVFLNTTHQPLKNILHLSSVSNGTYCFCSNATILYNTTYTWYINVTDQSLFSVYTSDIYTFTTTQNIADCNTTASAGGSNESWLIGLIILFSTFGIIAFVKQNRKQR